MKKGSPKLQRSNPAPKTVGKYVYFQNKFMYDFKLNKIYEGVNKVNDEKVLIKRIFKKFTIHEMFQKERGYDQQSEFMKIDHPNILTPIQYIKDNQTKYEITKKPELSLSEYIKGNKQIQEDQAFFIWVEILIACSFLKQKGFWHRCLLTKNIVMADEKWKITGLQHVVPIHRVTFSSFKKSEHRNILPPETLCDFIYNEKSSIWALGLLLSTLLSGKQLDQFSRGNKDGLSLICSRKFMVQTTKYHRIFTKLLSMTLRINVQNRASFDEVIQFLFSCENIPKNFKKVLNLKKVLMRCNQIEVFEYNEAQKCQIELIQKNLYFTLFLRRIERLLQKINIQQQYKYIVFSIQFYIRCQLFHLESMLTQKTLKHILKSVFSLNRVSQLLQQVKKISKSYSQDFDHASLNTSQDQFGVFKYIHRQKIPGDVFMIRLQILLRKFISENISELASIKQRSEEYFLESQYLIYAVDFCISLFQIQMKVISKGVFSRDIWDGLQVEVLRKMSECPFRSFIDEVYEEVIERSKELGLDKFVIKIE